ncbi:MAG: rRNA maturation RNase YbeY [Gemmatimonadota bacterium]
MASDVSLTVNLGGRSSLPEGLILRSVEQTLSDQGIDVAEISITLLDDADIERMNRDYLGRDRPTDVIAFSLGDAGRVLGDVYVGFDQAVRQADDVGVAIEEELVRLTIHGVLHVLGHDHPEGPERMESPMFSLQERLVRGVLDDAD